MSFLAHLLLQMLFMTGWCMIYAIYLGLVNPLFIDLYGVKMSKRKKADNINTGGGAHVDGNVNVDGHGTFVGRDQKSNSDRKLKLEIIVPIIVAIVTVVGAIIVAMVNYSAEIEKARLEMQM